MICLCSKSLKFFRTSKNGLKSDYFANIAHKIAKSKYFSNIFDDSDSPINSLSDYIYFVGVIQVFRKLLVGGHPAPPDPFILQNCVHQAAGKETIVNAGINLTCYHPPRANRRATNFFRQNPHPRGQLFSTKLRPPGRKNEAKSPPRA